ncbi:MAG: glutamate--tRNA ligase [Candidatus Improbicoccus pseudotrichonymphae]|uniref:Glutamate--tRNA ligase n=1 Tax=Candidatus Improbicoccus pseudotrichonymphae TaxID=3033792 RepID=A0AA48I8B0_9FIRM|nr:MAG: glutamate--tRNA ligase [Candidatus Improbicoccus pseudotrichonymphae]
MEKIVRTRFAPSPTGYMHIGNLRSALYAYLVARSRNGKFVLRIEDTDRARYIKGTEEVIYETLRISGIKHDEGPDIGGDFEPYTQSQRLKIYLDYAYKLVSLDKAYYCFCEKSTDSFGYDRKCRNLSIKEITDKLNNNLKYVIRQKVPLSGISEFQDEVFGKISIQNSEIEDQILIKSDGFPTYNFANVIDDHEMMITHVIRGCEYLSSTPKYNLIYEAFDWDVPKYVHLPLILGKEKDGTTAKLSKRNGSVSFEELISDGFLPEAIINYISFLGWCPESKEEFFSLSKLEKEFDFRRIGKSPAIFDYNKLLWMNSQYIKNKNLEELSEIIKRYISEYVDSNNKYKILELLSDKDNKVIKMLQPRIEKISEFVNKVSFLLEIKDFDFDIFCNQKYKINENKTKIILNELVKQFDSFERWNCDDIYKNFVKISEILDEKKAAIMWVARIAVSGLEVTPGGAPEIFEILGKKEILNRLKNIRY